MCDSTKLWQKQVVDLKDKGARSTGRYRAREDNKHRKGSLRNAPLPDTSEIQGEHEALQEGHHQVAPGDLTCRGDS